MGEFGSIAILAQGLLAHRISALPSFVLQRWRDVVVLDVPMKILTPVATMAELVWHVVAGMCVEDVVVVYFAGNIGSIAPSRIYVRSFNTPILVAFMFDELETDCGESLSSSVLLYFLGEFEVDTLYQDHLRRCCCQCGSSIVEQ